MRWAICRWTRRSPRGCVRCAIAMRPTQRFTSTRWLSESSARLAPRPDQTRATWTRPSCSSCRTSRGPPKMPPPSRWTSPTLMTMCPTLSAISSPLRLHCRRRSRQKSWRLSPRRRLRQKSLPADLRPLPIASRPPPRVQPPPRASWRFLPSLAPILAPSTDPAAH